MQNVPGAFRPIPGTGQTLAIGAAAVPSAAFTTGRWLRISGLGNFHYQIGTAPVALATDALVKATDPPEYIRVTPGEKISIIQDGTATGNVSVVELDH